MPITPRERLARVLDGSQTPGAFSAQLSVPARDVGLTVAGAGISLPVKAPQADRKYSPSAGRRQRTLALISGQGSAGAVQVRRRVLRRG